MKEYALSEVLVSFESGSRPKGGIKELDSGVPSLGAEHLDSTGSFNFSKLKLVPEDFHSSLKKGIVKQNDILIVKDGATTGKVSFVNERFPFKEASINEHIFRLEINSDYAFPPYIFRFLYSPRGKQQILRDFRGATVGGISREFANIVKIPLPTIDEQKRIAAILDKADAIRRKREKAIQLADEFLRSVFLDMFGDPATNPKKWPEGTIRELVSEAKYGTSKKANGYEGKYPILRMNNITYKGFLDLSDLKYIDMDEKEESKYLVKNGDLLFNRTNSKELVGKTAVYNKDEAMAVAGYLIRVRSNEKSNPNYISAYLNSKHGKATLFGMCKSIIGMANINAQELQDIKILIPPIKLQNKYAEIVGDVYEKKKKLSKALDESKILIKSLTQSAFR